MMAKQDNKMTSLMYVNYAPYGNAGYILDYLKRQFSQLVYISFSFHTLSRKNYTLIEVYEEGRIRKRISLWAPYIPRGWVYYFAPLLSLITAVELIFIAFYVSFRFKVRPQIFFAPNAFLIFIGFILKTFSLVDKVVFWVWDYYPTPS